MALREKKNREIKIIQIQFVFELLMIQKQIVFKLVFELLIIQKQIVFKLS